MAFNGKTYRYNFKNRVTFYKAIFRSYIDYCSTFYAEKLTFIQKTKLTRLQRIILIGVISRYRTITYRLYVYVSRLGCWILAGISPLEFFIRERNTVKKIKRDRKLKECTTEEKVKIEEAKNPILKEWQNLHESGIAERIAF